MRRGTAIFTACAMTVAAISVATYAFGKEPHGRARMASAPHASNGPGSGSPSATGEDGGSGPSPSAKPSPSPSKPRPRPKPPCPTGAYQRQVEANLAKLGGYGPVTVDGKVSVQDCRAIRKFQHRYGIYSPQGIAGPTTANVSRRLVETRRSACQAGSGLTVCLDLTHQTMWVVRNGTTVLGPTVVRTGRAGLATPSGHYTITERKVRGYSSYYHVPLPYWQRFVRDMGFHQTPSYIHDGPGSHGCVNLLPSDALALWRLTSVGSAVHSFGRKPGT